MSYVTLHAGTYGEILNLYFSVCLVEVLFDDFEGSLLLYFSLLVNNDSYSLAVMPWIFSVFLVLLGNCLSLNSLYSRSDDMVIYIVIASKNCNEIFNHFDWKYFYFSMLFGLP